MRALDTINKPNLKEESSISLCVCFFRNIRSTLVIKINIISYLSNSSQPTLNLKCNRPSHWAINKLIKSNNRIEDTRCRIETITGHQFQ